MTETHSNNEKKIIREGWQWLEELCDTRNMRDAYELKQALRAERPERNSIHAARALLIQCFLEGLDSPDAPVSCAYSYSTGCRTSLLMGADWARTVKRWRGDVEYYGDAVARLDKALGAMRLAANAHDRFISRALERI